MPNSRKRDRTLVALTLCISLLCGQRAVAETPQTDFEHYLDGLVAAQFSDYNLAGMTIAMVKDGEVVLQKGYGFADLENQVAVDPSKHLFRPGSVSKLFTWTAVMQLVEQGKLDLNTDVATYVTQFPIPNEFNQPITLTHIMTHTTGLEDGAAGYLFADEVEDLIPLAESLATYTPTQVRAPGTYSAYSNWSTALAGLIVANVSGMAFEDYVTQNILKPLGMHSSSFNEPLPADLIDNMSVGYTEKLGGLAPFGFEYIKNFGPAGALSATASDMARFMIAHLNNGRLGEVALLQPSTVALMHSNLFSHHPSAVSWAHGFYEYKRNGQRFIGHGGDTIAFHSQVVLDLEQNFGFYLSFNAADGAQARAAIVDGIVDYFYPPTPLPHNSEPLPGSAQRIAEVAGMYRLNRRSYTKLEAIAGLGGDLPIVASGEGAITIPVPNIGGRFIETEPYVFTEQGGQNVLAFSASDDGAVSHAFISIMAADKVGFFEQASQHQLVILLAMLASVFVLINGIRNRGQAMDTHPRRAKYSLMGASFSNLGLLVGIGLIGASFDMNKAIFDFPPTGTGLVLVFPILSGLFTLAALGYLLPVWRAADCGFWARIRYTYVTGVYAALIAVMSYWNLLGWKYY